MLETPSSLPESDSTTCTCDVSGSCAVCRTSDSRPRSAHAHWSGQLRRPPLHYLMATDRRLATQRLRLLPLLRTPGGARDASA